MGMVVLSKRNPDVSPHCWQTERGRYDPIPVRPVRVKEREPPPLALAVTSSVRRVGLIWLWLDTLVACPFSAVSPRRRQKRANEPRRNRTCSGSNSTDSPGFLVDNSVQSSVKSNVTVRVPSHSPRPNHEIMETVSSSKYQSPFCSQVQDY
jgi:hypothetical protein